MQRGLILTVAMSHTLYLGLYRYCLYYFISESVLFLGHFFSSRTQENDYRRRLVPRHKKEALGNRASNQEVLARAAGQTLRHGLRRNGTRIAPNAISYFYGGSFCHAYRGRISRLGQTYYRLHTKYLPRLCKLDPIFRVRDFCGRLSRVNDTTKTF